MSQESGLTAYWITYPEDRGFPIGQGVTAHSLGDAFRLLEEAGWDFHRRASRVEVRQDVTRADLTVSCVLETMGPIVVRGVWYPFLGIR